MPAAIDEEPAALLELERRDDAITGLPHRGWHAVEKNLVSADVVAACADTLILSELGRVRFRQLDDRSLPRRVLCLQRVLLGHAAQLPEREPHEQCDRREREYDGEQRRR